MMLLLFLQEVISKRRRTPSQVVALLCLRQERAQIEHVPSPEAERGRLAYKEWCDQNCSKQVLKDSPPAWETWPYPGMAARCAPRIPARILQRFSKA